MYLFADYHTHSQYSHGRGSLRGNLMAARARGLEELAITDHGPALAFGLGVKDSDQLLEVKNRLREMQDGFPGLKVLCGVEANVLNRDGDLDVPWPVLEQLDIVLAGLHPNIFPRTWENLRLLAYYFGGKWSRAIAARSRYYNTEALIRAVERYPVAIVTHPGLKLSVDTRELARACARRGTALEINSSHGYLTLEFVQVAAEEGVKFAINSDAHHPSKVGVLEPGLLVARRAGLAAHQVINARGDREH